MKLNRIYDPCRIFAAGVFLITIFICSFAYAAVGTESVRDFFPKASELPGGSELWLNGGVKTKHEKNYSVYTASYTYYSGKADKLLNIKRKASYKTDVAIYSYNSFVDASEMFRSLTLNAPKKRSQMVRFGDMGQFFLFPKSGYINDADFYLVFISRTFVVWIHSDDGFAIMDVANPVNDSIKKFIADNPKLYMLKSLHVTAEGQGLKPQTKTLTFTVDYPSSIEISGRVFDKRMNPLQNIAVRIQETGDTLTTDKKGVYKKVINLDGTKDIALSANFYMEAVKSSGAFESGLLETVLKSEGAEDRTQLWKLENVSGKLTGTAYVKTASGYSGYPVSGKLTKNTDVTLTLDCSRKGLDFKCEQKFSGQMKDGAITGSWTGTGGGGTFVSDMKAYVPVKRKIIITDDIADIAAYRSAKGGYAPVSERFPVISASDKDSTVLYVKPDTKRLGIDDIRFISARLVLTHLMKDQAGNLSVFAYEPVMKNGLLTLGSGGYAGQLYVSGEPYKAEFDISDIITGGGFVLGTVKETGNRGVHKFSGTAEKYDTLKPYFEITEYAVKAGKKVEKPFVMNRVPKKDGDWLSDKNRAQRDGIADMCFSGRFFHPKGRLTDFTLTISGSSRKVYNTNPLDIYPMVGFIKDNELLNRHDGSLDITLGDGAETYDICVSGTYAPEQGERISYRYIVNSSLYEGFAE